MRSRRELPATEGLAIRPPVSSEVNVVSATRAQLARMIDLKEFEVGVRLPPANVLAQQLRVSRPVVLQALKLLELEGRVSVGRGINGVRVLDARGANRPRRADWVVKNAKKILDMTVTREIVDPALARLAAGRRPRAQLIKDLTVIQEEMVEHHLDGPEPWFRLDIKFHWRIAEVADVEPLAELSLTARQWVAPALDLLTGARQSSHEEHREIIEAIKVADGDRAAAAAYEHVHMTTVRLERLVKELRRESS